MSFEVLTNAGGMPYLRITHTDGATADVHLQGAHVGSWVTAKRREPLFMSSKSVFAPGKALRGGIPICWPQFSDIGPGAVHGYARSSNWEFTSQEVTPDFTSATFTLVHPDSAAEAFRNSVVMYVVKVGGERLSVSLKVDNKNTDQPITFTTALHSYFKVSDISAVSLRGSLDGVEWADNLEQRAVKPAAPISIIDKEIDRIYRGTAGRPVVIQDAQAGLEISVTAASLDDTVLWNPWIEKNKRLSDLDDEGYKRFVCVESAAIKDAVVVPPGGSWVGEQNITVS
jgi:glucose-6-phosphate 1-epimerase